MNDQELFAIKKALNWRKGDFILSVRPERCYGSGWTNTPIWVIIKDINGDIREECLQPDEQTRDMRLLFDVLLTAHNAMINALAVNRLDISN